MNQAKKDFLSLVTQPARVGIDETSWLLGFNEHDIPVLVSAGLLKPLGHPTATGSKQSAFAFTFVRAPKSPPDQPSRVHSL